MFTRWRIRPSLNLKYDKEDSAPDISALVRALCDYANPVHSVSGPPNSLVAQAGYRVTAHGCVRAMFLPHPGLRQGAFSAVIGVLRPFPPVPVPLPELI